MNPKIVYKISNDREIETAAQKQCLEDFEGIVAISLNNLNLLFYNKAYYTYYLHLYTYFTV